MNKTILSLLIVLLAGGAYIGYEVRTVKKALSPTDQSPSTQTPEVTTKESNSNLNSTNTDTENKIEDEIENEVEDKNTPVKNNTSSQTTSSAQTQTTSNTAKTFTLAEIKTHNTASSCYTTIRGIVYDLTSFINQHPGGAQNILRLCGTDGTSAFENQHGGRPRPEQELKGHEIGVLK